MTFRHFDFFLSLQNHSRPKCINRTCSGIIETINRKPKIMKNYYARFKKSYNIKLVLFILLFTLSTKGVLSQTHYVGITYEPSLVTSVFSDIQHDTYPPTIHDFSSRLGNSFGMDYLLLSDSKSYGIKSGFYLIDNGYTEKIEKGDPAFSSRTDKIYYTYLSIPIEFYKLFNSFYFNIGPNFNYAIKGKRELGTGETKEYSNNHFALGLKSEIGYRFELNEMFDLKLGVFNRGFLFAEGNMNYGLLINLNYKITK